MLGKLLKYEYKATSRYFIGLYIVLALLTIGNKIMLIIEDTSDVQLRVVDILFGIIMAKLCHSYYSNRSSNSCINVKKILF